MERPRPGTYLDGLPEKQYHNKDHGYSSTHLKDILKMGPQKLKWALDQPQKAPSEAMKIGSVLHCGLLRPEEMGQEIKQMPDFNLRTNAGRECKAVFVEENQDILVVNQKELDLGMGMVESCLAHDECCDLLQDSIRERSMYTEFMDAPFRARPDSYKDNILHELKSTKDGSPEGFAKQVANLNYHVSLAHYAHVMEDCAPEKLMYDQIDYRFIVVENTPPHSVAIYIPSDRMIYVGNEMWKEAMSKLIACSENDSWPGYNYDQPATEIDLPNWAVPREDEE